MAVNPANDITIWVDGVEVTGHAAKVFLGVAVAAFDTTPMRVDALWAGHAAGSRSVKAALAGFFDAGDGVPVDVQSFSSSGTWIKPATGVTVTDIHVFSGGNGAGSGALVASGVECSGGAGGSGGGYSRMTIPTALLGATEPVTVGAGGAGGAAQSTSNSNGLNGGQGGSSIFGSSATAKCFALAGDPQGGASTLASGGQIGVSTIGVQGGTGTGERGGKAGGSVSGSGGGVGLTSTTTAGGGGGGGISTTPTHFAGGNGGLAVQSGSASSGRGAGGTAGGGAGGAVTHPLPTAPYGGGGGGGGGSNTGGNGGAGSAGGVHGGGGGGGGSALNGSSSGAGGAGGAGFVWVVSY